jgi:c-di-GMP-binding flagellar brake protein YcgR
MQKKDRRKFIRLRAYHLAKYKVLSAAEGKILSSFAVIKDIGAGGACLKIEEKLPADTRLELRINFPNLSTPICTLAKVSWVRQIGKGRRYYIGVQFIEIEETVRKLIDEHIRFVYNKMRGKKE